MGNVVSLDARRAQRSEPWLNKRQAAQHLGCSVRWIEARQADAGLPFYRVKGWNMYRASELDEWVRRTGTVDT